MSKAVRVLAILAALVAWPAAARAQEAMTNCKPGTFGANYNAESHEHLKIKGREDALRYVFSGDVRITCNDITVAADEIESISDEDIATLRGHVVFKQTGVSISAETAVVNRKTHLGIFYTVSGTLKITESKTGDLFGGLEPDAYFSGESLEKTGPKTYVLTKGVLTTCTQPTPRWYMSFSGTITLEKHVLMHNVVLRAKNVPLLFLPAFYYPITHSGRNTGFLFPSYGSSAVSGLTLSNAFFLVLGRSMDATFFHTYMKKTGTDLGTEYRYVETAGTGKFNFDVLRRKAQFSTDNSTITTPAETNYTFTARVNQRLPHRLTFISNDNYFSSASAQQLYQQNVFDLSRRQSQLNGTLSGYHGYFRFGLNASLSDIYTTDVFTGKASAQRQGNLPMGTFSFNPKPLGGAKLQFNLNGTSGYLIRQDNLQDPTTNHSLWRTDILPTISETIPTPGFLSVTTSASWRFTTWSESTTGLGQPNLPVPITRQLFTTQFSIQGPKIYRDFALKPNDYAEKVRHLIIPFYSLSWNSPFHEIDRIVQSDPGIDGLVGGTAEMNYGVRTQLNAKRWTSAYGSDATQKTILEASISQRYYSNLLAAAYGQQDSSTSLYATPASSPFSPIALAITGRPADYATIRFTTSYDTHFGAFRQSSWQGGLSRPLVQINMGWTKKNLVPGLSGYDTPDTTNNYLNATVTLTHPNHHLGGTYSSFLDLKFSRFQQQRYVVYYNSQCCGISFDYQTVGAGIGLPADRRFSFSFTLAGIGSFSNPFGSFGHGGGS